MLGIRGLTKAYGDVVALDDVDLDVAAGRIVSLLGPNGAGVAGLHLADAGRVEVGGLDALARTPEVRRLIGLAPQELGVYPIVTVRQNLHLFGELAGLDRRQRRERIDEVAAALAIEDLLGRRAGELSGGQKRRVPTAIALLHRPSLLLLDEATTGADVETREHLLHLVEAMAAEGTAVLYSTHYLHEVEALGASVVILDRGRVIARGEVRELIATYTRPVVELSFDGPPPPLPLAGAVVVDGRLRVTTDEPGRTIAELSATLADRGTSPIGVEVIRPDLEAVYQALTGRRYAETDREEAADVVAG